MHKHVQDYLQIRGIMGAHIIMQIYSSYDVSHIRVHLPGQNLDSFLPFGYLASIEDAGMGASSIA
jgi:hypothetical protein